MLFAEESAKLVFEGGSAAVSTLITFLLGIGIVFVGLVALILIIKIMGAVMRGVGAKKTVEEPAAPEPVRASEPEGDRG